MKRSYFLILVIIINVFTGLIHGQPREQTASTDKINLVFSLNIFHNIKTEDAKALAIILANHIKKQYDLNFDFDVSIIDGISNKEELLKLNFDYIILTSEEYILYKNLLPLEPYATSIYDGHVGFRYLFIVNKNSKYNDLSQLKNTSINVLARQNQKIPFLWLDKLLKEKNLPSHEKYFKSITTDYKATNILLPVFFNKADACIISEASLKVLTELNPSLTKDLSILYTSDYFTLGIGCLNSQKKQTNSYNILKDVILKLHQTEYGAQFLKLFYSDQSVLFKEDYLQNVLKLYK